MGLILFCIIAWLAATALILPFFAGTKGPRKQEDHPDIRLSYFASGWQYRFTDPHGVMVIRTGFGTRNKALKTALAHRERVGRELEDGLKLDELVSEP
jgi:hypothetical protein